MGWGEERERERRVSDEVDEMKEWPATERKQRAGRQEERTRTNLGVLRRDSPGL